MKKANSPPFPFLQITKYADLDQGIFFAAFLLLSQSNQTQNGISSKWRDRSSIDSIDFFQPRTAFLGENELRWLCSKSNT